MAAYDALAGADLVTQGVADLRDGRESVPALLVSIGVPRLRAPGLEFPPPVGEPEHRLYQRLSVEDEDAAPSRHNALVRRLVSFERAIREGFLDVCTDDVQQLTGRRARPVRELIEANADLLRSARPDHGKA